MFDHTTTNAAGPIIFADMSTTTATTSTIDFINAATINAAYPSRSFYDDKSFAAILAASELESRVGREYVHLVMGSDAYFAIFGTDHILVDLADETKGIVGSLNGYPIHITPEPKMQDEIYPVIVEPNTADVFQYRKHDYVLDGSVIWRVSGVTDDAAIHLVDTTFRVLTGEMLKHPENINPDTAIHQPVRRDPPAPPTETDMNDLFGDVLPE